MHEQIFLAEARNSSPVCWVWRDLEFALICFTGFSVNEQFCFVRFLFSRKIFWWGRIVTKLNRLFYFMPDRVGCFVSCCGHTGVSHNYDWSGITG